MIWFISSILLNLTANIFIVLRVKEFSVLASWKVKTKNGYKWNSEYYGRPYWAVLLPFILTPFVFKYFVNTIKQEEEEDLKRRKSALEYQKNNPPKR